MKMYIKHTDCKRVKSIVDKLIDSAGRVIVVEKPDIDKTFVDKVVEAVKIRMTETMDDLLTDFVSTTIEFDIETTVIQTFENVLKSVTWEKSETDSDAAPDHQQV